MGSFCSDFHKVAARSCACRILTVYAANGKWVVGHFTWPCCHVASEFFGAAVVLLVRLMVLLAAMIPCVPML